ncbi:type IX secretion system sortase PorU [Flavobacterium sp.]|uniref:type IX secretion system sortase PorU n=1 Tax=Flavobacterium sp. TaxID=239 RepID=UPI0037521BE7
MKKISIFIFLLFSVFSFSQVRENITIEWNENISYQYGDYSVKIPQFSMVNFNYNNYTKEILYTYKKKNTSYIDENSLQITNIIFETIDEIKLGDLNKSLIPNTIKASIKNSIARDEISVILNVSPIIKEGNTYKKIKSFTYNYSNSSRINNSTSSVAAISNSVLSSGKWYRFYIEKSGVYKISKSFLESLGVKTSGLNPKSIKIFGSGGKMVPLSNNAIYPIDLSENAIQVIGEEDNAFDSNDYVLFYGEGLDNWSNENKTNLNLYSKKAYYYVTTDGGDGKRILDLSQPTGSATTSINTFDDIKFHEEDLNNIAKIGRVWFGESFSSNNEQEFILPFENIVTSSQAKVEIHVGGNSFVQTKFDVNINSQELSPIILNAVVLNTGIEASHNTLITNVSAAEEFTVKLNFDNGGVPASKGFLDYIIIRAKRNLTGNNKQFRFQYNDASTLTGIGEYSITNASSLSQIWDITDIYNTSKVTNSGASTISFKSNLGETRNYIAVDTNDYYTPLKESKPAVANQDLKGTIFNDAAGNFKDIDYLIVTPSAFNSQAEKLANFHRNYSGLNVKVVNLEMIYHEFSSGKQDIAAIRNFVKYVYDNPSVTSKRIKYLNLFGDASFDFKDRISNNTNFVPIYHSTNSYTSGESSFASDDFFGLMNTNEGDVEITNGGVDIAVGRMIVSSTKQADEMVNKIIEYHDLKSYGSWRNNYVSISDDSDKPSDITLQSRQNSLTDSIHQQKPFINYKKILLDAYQQVTSAGGNRYPKAKEDIRNAFENGSLVFNYLGHGGEDGLTGERIWDKFDGSNFNNRFRYPLFITLTCEFSRFDNPLRPTAGEYTYWNPVGGAISMITTIRSIGQGSAENFNDVLSEKLFSYDSDEYPSIAEALRLAKNASFNNSSTRVVFLLGDPALMLAIAKPRIVLTKVNDIPINQPFVDFQALAYVKLSGEVQDGIGNFLPSYNGEMSVNIFDKNYLKTTFNNDNNSPPITFTSLGETIFRGNASVNNGLFEFGFVVPKDIKIPIGNGRISFYSKRNTILLDKTGYNTDIKVGGVNTNAVADTTPPKLRLYMNDETFIDGGITNQSPFFLAFLEDEHGINTSSGIGHDMVAILDGDENNPYILNDYYETELDDYTKGKVRFPFRNLSLGLHTITFKAWDVYNNFISADIRFIVVGDESVTLQNVLNYPNPFVSYTQFWFTHNRPFEPLDVQVQIITITGKIVKTINQSVMTEGFLSRDISWDGKDDFGDKIGKGVYIYKLIVKSTLTNKTSEKIEKLVIL